MTLKGGLSVLHLERIKAAAASDAKRRSKRKDVNQAAARIAREATEKST